MSIFSKVRGLTLNLALVAVLAVAVFGTTASAAAAGGATGAVYVLGNAADANQVIVFDRAADGTLGAPRSVATGGRGGGSPLGSQGALTLSQDGQWLFAVNAGSDSVSAFAVTADGLVLKGTADSGGQLPISVTSYNDLVYVLNAGGSGNIRGFRRDANGTLTPIGDAQALSSNAANPAQVQFSPDGQVLVVTEKATNKIDTYTVGADGVAGNRQDFPSSGSTPFGFAFNQNNVLVVSEAADSAASSYAVATEGGVTLITGSVKDKQAAACWVAVTDDGRRAFVANAGTGVISSYRIGSDGRLALARSAAAKLGSGSGPIDLGLSRDGEYLYQLAGTADTINGFRVNGDGTLSKVGKPLPIPVPAVGVAVQ